jgi:pimeloyl-ACP methyl ester carboxylesterase
MVSEQDNAISPACERFMAQRMNATVEAVSGGSHAAFIAQPAVAAALILNAAGMS